MDLPLLLSHTFFCKLNNSWVGGCGLRLQLTTILLYLTNHIDAKDETIIKGECRKKEAKTITILKSMVGWAL
jgi:hypothetical protein